MCQINNFYSIDVNFSLIFELHAELNDVGYTMVNYLLINVAECIFRTLNVIPCGNCMAGQHFLGNTLSYFGLFIVLLLSHAVSSLVKMIYVPLKNLHQCT